MPLTLTMFARQFFAFAYLYVLRFNILYEKRTIIMRVIILVIVLVLLGMNMQGYAQMQPGFKDFDVSQGIGSSSPIYLTAYDGKLYFYGNDGSSGRELHLVQGSNSATLPKNVNAGSKNAIGVNFTRPAAGMDGVFYFTADNGAAGAEMYKYDGSNPPSLVFDATLSSDSSNPDNYTVLNNVLYFTATTATHGTELWQHTGTGIPTRITDINAGTADGVSGPMVAYSGKLYFVGNDGTDGSELWVFDPSSSTAQLAVDIETGASSSAPANLMMLNNKLYFSANTFADGRELYEYDGTTATRITDISPGAISSLSTANTNAFAWFNNKLYFAGRDTTTETHLWSYDPASSAVSLVHKVNPNGDARPQEFVVYNNRLIFTVNDGANGFELYAYDGVDPPAIIGDLCPGVNSSLPSWLTPIGDELYFSANNCNNSGIDLFSYNDKRVGVRNVLFDADVEIFPNPVVKELHINMQLKRSERLQLRLADTGGRTIYDEGMRMYDRGNNKTEIPMRGMPPGAYIYYITNEEGTTYLTGKVMKQ